MRASQIDCRHTQICYRFGDFGIFDSRDDAVAFPRFQKLGNPLGQAAFDVQNTPAAV